ncbi:Ig-like domain-containing protein [Chlorobaculum sp. MV4-Y]|uniref:Ig-like domain-containing protein n=1 Tax=Chlorobaculum sp. MV4-Y TaxID=2976335 RepID=UPI0021AE3A5E|nr:Ig-like domain-containing protein [Chlorobaculum sp. MV4-Y]UWX57391.1 Ig-like domain-containing protein [Chlorobaculum sp. MV4-Y]
MKEFPGLKILATILIPLLFSACAVDRPPTGGPPDRSSLSVTSSLPTTASINTSPEKIRIGFTHYVSRADLLKSIFFSPRIDDYEVTMHGKEADIRLYSPLQQNRTYTLTLRAPLKSLDGNHQLDRSWVLAFSTGPVIDQGTIEGQVWTNRLAPARDVSVMAYTPSSSSRLQEARPDYITQTGPSGEFRFQHLAPGSYRIVATTGEVGNVTFDHKEETFAVTSSPTVHTGMAGVAMRFAPDARSANTLSSCRTLNNREIEITFKNTIPARSFNLSAIRIENTATGAILPVLGYFSPSKSSEDNTFRLLTGPMEGRTWYRLRFSPGENTGQTSELKFSGDPRTERYPELSASIVPADGANNVITETIRPESGSSIELQCNLPVVESSVKPAVTLSLSEKGRQMPVPFTISRIDSRTFAIVASEGFQHSKDYLVQVRPGMLKGLVGEPSKTALVKSRFSTAGPEAYGEISGSGRAIVPAVVVEARRSGCESGQRMVAKTNAYGTFSFSFHDLPAGEYTISGFIPSATGTVSPMTKWNSGSLTPFVPSDPFTALTVTIRGGWTTENVRLDIPSIRQSGLDRTESPEKP